MSKKLFTKVVSLSLTAAMVLSMAPVNASAAKAVKPKSMKAPKASKIKVGQTKTITASRKSKKSTNDVKYVNFKPAKTKNIGIGVKTSDDTIVSVEKVSNGKYTYTGVNTGTATLTITSRAKTAKGKKLQAKLDVTVINPFKVTQTGAYTFTMSTADKLEKVDKRDVKVTQEGNTVDNAVKSVKLSEDKMSVEVTMEIPFVDQQKYNVEFGKEKDSFVASVGAPAAINIKTQTVVINKPTEIEYAVVDEKGMDVTKVVDKAKLSVDVKTKSGYYDASSNKLTLWKVGDTAEVIVTYHTWTYDDKTGKENVKEGKATITCVDKSAVTVVGLDKWTIADRVLSWDTDEMKTMISAGKSSQIWVRMKKSDGTYVNNKDNKNDFSFEPISTAVLYVYSMGQVYATREGMEYAKVTYYDGTVKYQYTLPITVGAKAKPTTVALSQPFVTISSKNTTVPTVITMKVLDQYGEPVDNPGFSKTPEHLSGSKVATITEAGLSKDGTMRKIAIVGNGTEGTGVYKLTANDGLNITLTVSARDVSSITTNDYMLKAEVEEFDVTLRKDTSVADADKIAEGIKLDLYATKAGLISGLANDKMDLAGAEFTINGIPVKPENPDTAPAKLAKTPGATSLVFKPVIKDASNQYISLLKAGVYTITVKFEDGGKTYVSSTSVVVKNDTAKAEKDKSYKVGKLNATTATPYEDVAKTIIEKADTPLNTVADKTLKDYSIVLAIKDGKATKAGKGEAATVDALASEVYIDTAVLPSFRLDADSTKAVWVLEERLNQKVETIAPAVIGTLGNDTTEEALMYYGTNIVAPEAVATVQLSSTKAIENLMVSKDDFTYNGTNSANYVIKNVTTAKVAGDPKKLDVKFTIAVKEGAVAAAGDTLTVEYTNSHIDGTPPGAPTATIITPTAVNATTVAIDAATVNANEFNAAAGKEIVATVTGTGLTQLANNDQLYNVAKWDVAPGTVHDNFKISKVVAEGTAPTDTTVKVKLTVKNADSKTVVATNTFKVKTKDLNGNTATATSANEVTAN